MLWEAEYASIREKNLKDQRERRIIALEACSGLKDWETRYLKMQRLLGLASVQSNGGDKEDISIQISKLLDERMTMLADAGFPADFLDLTYNCPRCKDYGYIGGKPCVCLEKWRFNMRTQRSNMVGFETQTFENFDERVFPEKGEQRIRMLRIRNACKKYAENFPANSPKNMLFLGNAGLGKSFLLNCIGRRVLDRGFYVLKVTGNQFHQMLIDEVIGGRNTRPLKELIKADLLIFDDLGCEPVVKTIVESYFFSVLTERTAAGGAMIVASNLSDREISNRYGERTLSRLMDTSVSRTIGFKGEDLRLLRKVNADGV